MAVPDTGGQPRRYGARPLAARGVERAPGGVRHVGHHDGGHDAATGYGAVWGAYALAAASVQVGLQHAGVLVAPGPTLPARLGGLVLVAAGVFQFLPLKAACLSLCRSPVSFFLASWRDGPGGAFRMGVRHGSHCLGCCWALMAAAFALGVMNLSWMAALTVVLCVEKLVPRGAELGRMAGGVAVILGIWMMAAGP